MQWRISYGQAQAPIRTNMVQVTKTGLGLGCAWMFAVPNYWIRLFAAILFLASVTIDGVDGELARLKMKESDFGGALDIFTHNVVHVGIFILPLTACYPATHISPPTFLIPTP